MTVGISLQKLGATPTPEQVDEYMKSWGLQSHVIGTSVQGRHLLLYEFPPTMDRKQNHSQDRIPTILFLSLVHGNEPMGLISLLSTVHVMATAHLRGKAEASAVRVLFFPIVNVDGYWLNLNCAAGHHRGNMRRTPCNLSHLPKWFECNNHDNDENQDAQIEFVMGVDLNRNFPVDWNGTYASNVPQSEASSVDACSSNYHGSAPISEPETQAIRHIANAYPLVAALSFHSLSAASRGAAMIIHPYASSRPMEQMPMADQERFRSWSNAMNANNLYKVGTALEVIDYAAGGTTIDWLYSTHNTTAFVLEVVPLCNSRWCPATPRLYRSARDYAQVARRLVELVVHDGRVVSDAESIQRSVLFLLFLLALYLIRSWKKPLQSFVRRRIYGKFKNGSVSETEMQNLKP